MKKWILLSAFLGVSVLFAHAQDDDMYFVPTKANVAKAKANYGIPAETYYSGSSRSTDEYNRRGSSYQALPADSASDIITFAPVTGEYPDSVADFELTRKMQRWDDYEPSASYWEGYSDGRRDSWGWHSPWYYTSYYYPWYDSWRYSWYDPWYYSWGSWYDPWYSWHYPYYGWGGYYGWYRPYHYGYYGGYYGGYSGYYGGYRGGKTVAGTRNHSINGRSATGRTWGNTGNARTSSSRSSSTGRSSGNRSAWSTGNSRSSGSYTPSRSSSSSSGSYSGSSSRGSSGGGFSGGGSRSGSVGGGSIGGRHR